MRMYTVLFVVTGTFLLPFGLTGSRAWVFCIWPRIEASGWAEFTLVKTGFGAGAINIAFWLTDVTISDIVFELVIISGL